MSRISKWKLEKTKVKVVFRLQFHATHVPQTGWDKLFISFIPADTGKPTAKTTKANVRNGSCKWGDPIYETTRLLQDSKSKQYDEKLYKLVVSMGSSRASILGEATINLADYVDASKPTIATIPLHGCNFGTILHITVQLLTSKTGFREFEQQRELREKGLQSGSDSHGDGASVRIPSSEGVTNDQAYKVSARIKFKADASELSSLEEEVNVNEEYADSATGFDGSSNTSGSLYAEKHDTSCTKELDSVKCTSSGDLYGLSHFQSPRAAREDLSDHQNTAQGSTGSTHGWGSNNSMDNELAIASEENNRLRGSLELAESSLFNLKLEVSSLQGVADELGAETQKLSHELSAEISSAEELVKEVSSMKSECLKFKDDIIGLKNIKLSAQIPLIEDRDNQVDPLVQSVQLQFLNGISVVEGKIRELQKKTVVPHDGDTKFIHLELEALLNFLLDFKLGNGEAMALPNTFPSERADLKKIRKMSHFKDEQFESGNGFGLDLCPPESVLQHLSSSPPVSDVVNPLGAVDAMKGQIFDLVRELDEAKIEKEALTRKMDQMECYYEALIHELEENQKRLLGELQLLRNEHSTCLYALSVSKTEVESLREEMNQQMLQSVQERHDLEAINLELERRATTSEAALRRARLNYSIAVDKLQKDLELLSSQVTSMFESNESLIKQALPSQPVSQVGRELVQNPEDYDVANLTQFQNQNLGLRKRSAGGDILLEDLKRSVCMQEDLYRKVEEELVEMYSISLNLDIYSKALEEYLREANADLNIMNGKMSELVEELTSSTASQNHLMLRLQKATDEIHTLNEYKSSSISQCSEMALQNQLLEDKFLSVSEENHLLAQKLIDWESTLLELRSFQSKYATCSAENAELSLQLKQEALENEKLMDEMSHLKEESYILKAESDELVSSKRNLEESIKLVQDKLANLLFSYNKQFGILAGSRSLNLESVDIKDAVLRLEEVQHSASMKICQLMEENRSLKSERASADVSLSTVRSEILLMKQKFKIGIQDIVTKLDVSNALVDRLQAGIESVANKLHLSSEIEEKFAEQNEVLLADFALLEDQMQKLTCRNGHLAREISNLDTLAEELGRNKLEITELMHGKKELTLCLMDKTDESMKLSCEVNSLKEDLKTLRDELHDEKASTYELERKVQDLNLCLSKDQDKLVEFEHQKAELMHTRELASHLEMEKSRLDHLLHQQNELMEELKKSCSYQASLESQLSDMYDYSLATDVQHIYVSSQHKNLLDELRQKLASSEVSLRDLQKRYHDTESMLNHSLASEANWRHEKDSLLASLESLRSDLEVSEAQNKLLSESNNEIKNQLEESNGCLRDLQKRYHDTESVLNHSLAGEANWKQEKDSLLASLESLRSDLEVSEAQNKRLSESNNEIKNQLEESNGCLRDLQKRYHDTESVLNHSLTGEANWKQEKDSLLASLESLRSDLEVSEAQNKHFSESNNEIKNQLEESNGCLRDLQKRYHVTESMLNHSLAGEANWRQEKDSLLASLETLRSDLEVSEAQNKLLSESNNEIKDHLEENKGYLSDLQKRYHDTESMLNHSLAGEDNWRREKDSLLASLESLRSDLEVSEAQNKLLSESNNEIRDEFEESKRKLTMIETHFSLDSSRQASDVLRLQNMITDVEEEMTNLILSKDELEVLAIVLKGKVDEQSAHITLLEGYKEELMILRSQCNELSKKLGEQVLKTEEFKNLSVHLKELKDMAEAECVLAREKRENEVPSATGQDSLRIAFMKEQYETKVQELKQQLSISKKHGEEMLMRLQDAIDEIENRKKSEAVSLKKNEELSTRLSALEAELMTVLSEKREKSNTYDRTKAELECALLSLECCKEEKEKLGASLLEFEAEKSYLTDELNLVKGQLEDLKCSTNLEKDEYGSEPEVEQVRNGSTGDASPVIQRENFVSIYDRENAVPTEPILTPEGEIADSIEPVRFQMPQDPAPYPQSNGNISDVNNEHLGAQKLRSSIERLHEELEKMKNENTIFDIEHDVDTDFQASQREITQLRKANEELRSMFPLFDEISSGGNALDRVLALEIELAEALKVKNKSNNLFQSSFLKQHSDEEAVFKSFRDINELIKEMLELKGRHAAVEAELREMHNRYSQLSLQFAEVEGERQKLKMTLKNVRASKR